MTDEDVEVLALAVLRELRCRADHARDDAVRKAEPVVERFLAEGMAGERLHIKLTTNAELDIGWTQLREWLIEARKANDC